MTQVGAVALALVLGRSLAKDEYPARIAEGLPIKGDHEVWVVRFRATAAPCPPGGSTCESPRPGTVTVLLDYLTGERYVTAGYYPNPNP